ncbi:MAG TPA: RidA family protein [Candidatus Limnocylindrales bacterium]|nr:RidA family protein [Candidatus Limnocylindrales bacterium]
MTEIEIFNPEGIRPPAGTYSHVARVPAGATLVVVAGQVGVEPDGALPSDFGSQCELVFANLRTALEAAGAGWANVIQTMTFLTRREDVPGLRAWREREFARLFPDGRYPPSTLLIVSGLASEEMLIEVQAVAAI